MANYRQIHVSIWKDEWFMDLAPQEKVLFIYLFSNESTSLSGLYKLPIKVIEFETGLERKFILEALEKFSQANKVHYEDGVIWVVNLSRYHQTKSPKVETRKLKDIEAIPNCALKRRYLAAQIGYRYSNDTSLQLKEKEEEKEKEKEKEEEAAAPAIPQTPKQAVEHPDLKLFQEVSGRIPGVKEYGLVIQTVQLLRQKIPEERALIAYLSRFWLVWSGRKTKDGRPYDASSLVWLTEWAVNDHIPPVNGKNGRSAIAPTEYTAAEKKKLARAEYMRQLAALEAQNGTTADDQLADGAQGAGQADAKPGMGGRARAGKPPGLP